MGNAMAYEVLMIDPPWQQSKAGKRKVRPHQGKTFNYRTMDTAAIFDLLDREILPLAAKDHVVFIWAIDKYLAECEAAMQGRGYRRHCRLIWDKGNGIAPAFTVRFSHEYLLWYYRIRLPPVAKEARGLYRTVLQENARQHSSKPEAAYQMIESFYPAQNKLDVFSRQHRKLWTQFGDEPDYYNEGSPLKS